MKNKISFLKIDNLYADVEDIDDEVLTVVDILIDGQNLLDIVKKFELRFAEQYGKENVNVGGYAGLPNRELFEALVEGKWTHEGTTTILGCDCGITGCWTLVTRITEKTNTVVWDNFQNPRRSKTSSEFWDYSEFPSFKFDRAEYESALNELKNITSTISEKY